MQGATSCFLPAPRQGRLLSSSSNLKDKGYISFLSLFLAFKNGWSDCLSVVPSFHTAVHLAQSPLEEDKGSLLQGRIPNFEFSEETNAPISGFSETWYINTLKACIREKSLIQVRKVFAHLTLHILEPSNLLQEHFVLTLAKLSGLDDALHIFERLQHRTVFSWTAIISGFADHGRPYAAINMYQNMQAEGVEPDRFTFIGLFKACGTISDLKRAAELHLEAQQRGLSSNIFVGNTVLSMYGKCGAISEAENVFVGELTEHTVVSWTAMMAAYVENGQAERALQLYRQMRAEGVSPNDQTFVSAVQACGLLGESENACHADGKVLKSTSLEVGQALHVDARRAGFSSDVYVTTTLVNMYSKCGALEEAEIVFHKLSRDNVASWTSMMSAYVEHDQGAKALQLFKQMQQKGISPNEHTFVCMLQACDALTNSQVNGALKHKSLLWEIGKAVHTDARSKSVDSGMYLGNALVSMYGKYGVMKEAEHMFAGLPQRSVVSWTAMLSAYLDQKKPDKVLQAYRQMLEEGGHPNQQTLVVALQACGSLAESEVATFVKPPPSIRSTYLEICKSLHVDAEKMGFATDVFVGSALLTVYGKLEALSQAREVFCALPEHDMGSWNAMLSAYVEQARGEEALRLYEDMHKKHMMIDSITLSNVLQACSQTCSYEVSMQLHFSIISNGHDFDEALACSLIHAYGACASIHEAKATLNEMARPDVASYNAYITGCAAEVKAEASFCVLEQILLASLEPDTTTIAAILSSCIHAGTVAEGIQCFVSMRKGFGLTPDLRHYAGMIDLVGRAGDFKRLENVLWGLPMQADLPIWLGVLWACNKHGNATLGKVAFDTLVRLQSKKAGVMPNPCAEGSMEDGRYL